MMIERALYPPYGEAFQREARPDFESLFHERRTTPPEEAGP
jgi:hypothetical protein